MTNKEKYFLIADDWEGGGGLHKETYDTEEEAIKAVKNSFFASDIVIKGEIVYDPINASEDLENASNS